MAACIYSPLIKNPRRVSNDFMYVADMLTTLAGAAGITINGKSLDGVNQWDTISSGAPSPRREILYNIETRSGYSAVLKDGWKLINGSETIEMGWIGSTGFDNANVSFKSYFKDIIESEAAKSLPELDAEFITLLRDEATIKCYGNKNYLNVKTTAPRLFNVINDPCETNDLADTHVSKVDFLLTRLNKHFADMLPSRAKPLDPKCNPENFNYTWSWWQEDELEPEEESRNLRIYALSLFIVVAILGISYITVRYWKKC